MYVYVYGWGCGPKTENFTKFLSINASHRRIICTIFTKFSQIVGSFVLGHELK